MTVSGEGPAVNGRFAACRPLLFGLGAAAVGWVLADPNRLFPLRHNVVPRGVLLPPTAWLGFAVMAFGAVVAAVVSRGKGPEDPWSQEPPQWRLSWASVAVLVFAFGMYAALIRHLAGGGYAHSDVVLLAIALALVAIALRVGEETSPAAEGVRPRLDLAIAVGVAGLVGLVNSLMLTRWHFAWIGDEFAFFDAARDIMNGAPWNFFDLTWVYEAQPTVDTLYQIVFLKLVGVDIVGWRLSQVVLIAVTAGLLYLVARPLLGRPAALFGAAALGCSQAAIAFVRIGYNNLHCLFWQVAVVGLLLRSVRSRRPIDAFLLGCGLGACFYTFMGALFAVAASLLVIWLDLLRRPSRRSLALALLAILGLVMVAAPGLIVTSTSDLGSMVASRTWDHPMSSDPRPGFTQRLLDSFVVFWFNPGANTHFVSGPLLDPIAGLCFAVGLVGCALSWRSLVSRLAIAWFGIGLVVVVSTSYLPQPHLTRLVSLTAVVALIAGVGFKQLTERFAACGAARAWRLPLLTAAALAAVIAINLVQVFWLSPQRLRQNPFSLTLWALQRFPGRTVASVDSRIESNLDVMLQAYPWLRERWLCRSLEELWADETAVAATAEQTVFIAYREGAARELERLLPESFEQHVLADLPVDGRPVVWLFAEPPG